MQFALWGATRGVESVPPPSSNSARSWRLGVRLADLKLAIGSRDSARTAQFATEIAELLSGSLGATYFRRIADSAQASGGRMEQLVESGREAIAPPVDTGLVTFAGWVEEARIAAHQGNAEFFGSRESRRALDLLRVRNEAIVRDVRDGIAKANWPRVENQLALLLGDAGR
jgi:hypothetical protein